MECLHFFTVLCSEFCVCFFQNGSLFSFEFRLADHLPTYILFDKATEVARFPEIMNESKVFVPKITKVVFFPLCFLIFVMSYEQNKLHHVCILFRVD